jgi:glycolate oxidase
VSFIEELAAALPGAVVTDPDLVEGYRYDRTTWLTPGHPVAVAFPTTTAQVATAVTVAGRHQVPIVARGAGSSLCGGSQAIDGALTLSLERMDRILAIDPVDQLARVEPGVLNADLSVATMAHGLFYPPDPASKTFCSLGGNVATNAGGLCCVKYGVTRDYVARLEVVLADGRVIETGHDTIKGVAGLDLTGLFVGSEGTLGIVTRVDVRLRHAPDGASTMVAFFPTLGTAGEAVAALTASGLQLSLCEIMDRRTVIAVDDWMRMGLDRDAAALLLVQSDAPVPLRASDVERAAELCDRAGASYTTFTADPDEAEALLQARRLAGPALERLGEPIWDDVGVPRSRIPALLARIEEVADHHGAEVYTFGHAGDGNMHPVLLVPHGDDDARTRALAAFDGILEAALDLGGTITGEHGVGAAKAHLLAREIGTHNLAVQRAIKHALDPQDLLNPGRWLVPAATGAR